MSKSLSSLSYAAALGGAVLSMLPSMAAAQLTGNVSLTSDYVWRGSSQTREKPAVQAGVKYAHDSGFYASV
ncbi:TorF family putative porin [Burkholderia multivorans]|nr:TorF family putative porin [Burkholderia multivorans]